MSKARFLPILVVLLVMPLFSCSDDDDPIKPKPPFTGPRDNVLSNLQASWNDRNLSRYDQLLDADFIFYFSESDVTTGVVVSEYWSRAAEMSAATNIFDPNYSSPVQEPVQDIDLSLGYPEGDEEWTQVTPEDPVKYPGETWYQKIVTYNLTVQLPANFQFVGRNKQAQFTVRAATEDASQIWQIVEWRDDVGESLSRASRRGQVAALVEETTWGRVKSVYGE